MLILSLIAATAFAAPSDIVDDIHDAASTTTTIAQSIATATTGKEAELAAESVPAAKTEQTAEASAVEVATTHTNTTETANDDSNSDVNPTLRYLLEEFKSAMKSGLPMASEGVKSICFQIQMFGVGLILFNLFMFVTGIVTLAYGKKMWLYGTEINKGAKSDNFNPLPFVGSIIFGIGGIVVACMSLSHFYDAIMMAAAPVVWAISHLFNVAV